MELSAPSSSSLVCSTAARELAIGLVSERTCGISPSVAHTVASMLAIRCFSCRLLSVTAAPSSGAKRSGSECGESSTKQLSSAITYSRLISLKVATYLMMLCAWLG